MLQKLGKIRNLLLKENLHGLIVFDCDEHLSEYVSNHDKRIEYISGFTGENGTAVITQDQALLWTDSRFFLQAPKELGETWKMMKLMRSEPTISEYLGSNLPKDSIIGVDPNLISISTYKRLKKNFSNKNIIIQFTDYDLIDKIWDDQPSHCQDHIEILPMGYSGKSIEDKLKDVRQELSKNNVNMLGVTALDDICWLYNIRGKDIDYNPVVMSYALITEDQQYLFVDSNKVDSKCKEYFDNNKVIVKSYDEIQSIIFSELNGNSKIIWVDPSTCNMGLVRSLPKKQIFKSLSPIEIIKSVKNETEIKNMKLCHIYDGLACCDFLSQIESMEFPVSEMLISDIIYKSRENQPDFRGLSFPSIVAGGANSSVVHYIPSKEKEYFIKKDEPILLDTGGQYLTGTTDITRTICVGNPSPQFKKNFTLVLKGHIAMASAIFPVGISGSYLDGLARQALYDNYLDFGHATGHGVGSYLNVHEGPMYISLGDNPDYKKGLLPGMFVTDEPGYYLDNEYGIRIESVLLITPTENDEFLKFENITYAPIQPELIEPTLLNQKEIQWCINYNTNCCDVLNGYTKDPTIINYLIRNKNSMINLFKQ